MLWCVAAILAVAFWSTSASAQQVITLDDAVRLAVASNHDLAASKLEVERSDARVKEAWGSALPHLDFGGSYTRALKKPVFFLPDFENPGSGVVTPIEIGSDHAFNLGFNANQILFNATVFIGVGAAKTYSQGARELFRAKTAETVTNARKAFFGVLVAREVKDLVQQTLTNAEENFRTARLLYEQGLVSEFDKLRAEVAVENIRPELYDAEKAERLALNSLRTVIGVPYDRALVRRLYAGQAVSVARGAIRRGGRVVESITMLSPYPDRTLSVLQPGTMIVVFWVPGVMPER